MVVNNLREQIRVNKLEADVEIISLMDCKSMSIGEKRNRLIEMSNGKYVVFVDDDDNVPSYYLTEILTAINYDPDVVGMKGIIKFEDGTPDETFIHSLEYKQSQHAGLYTKGHRPNHLNPIRRSIAIEFSFLNQNWEEDKEWSWRIYDHLKTEKFIDKIMYVYFAYGSKSQSSPDCKLSHI